MRYYGLQFNLQNNYLNLCLCSHLAGMLIDFKQFEVSSQ